MKQVFTLTNEGTQPATGIRAVFVLTRSVLKDARVSGLPAGARVIGKTLELQAIEIRWDEPLPVAQTILVEVELDGEPLSIARIVWVTDEGERNTVVDRIESMSGVDSSAISKASLRELTRDPLTVFALRREAIERTTDPKIQRYQRFFYDYDHSTHPQLVPKNPAIPQQERPRRVATIMRMAGVLSNRVLFRAELARLGQAAKAGQLPKSSHEDTEYASQLQLDIIRKHLSRNGDLDVDAFGEAFAMFVNGELRVQVSPDTWNSEPDSAFEFSFAEFAFMAIEGGVEAETWSRLVPSLVASQPIFAVVYPPDGTRASPISGLRVEQLSRSKAGK